MTEPVIEFMWPFPDELRVRELTPEELFVLRAVDAMTDRPRAFAKYELDVGIVYVIASDSGGSVHGRLDDAAYSIGLPEDWDADLRGSANNVVQFPTRREPDTIFDEIWSDPSPAYVRAVAASLDHAMACRAPPEYGGSESDACVLLEELARHGFRVMPIAVR